VPPLPPTSTPPPAPGGPAAAPPPGGTDGFAIAAFVVALLGGVLLSAVFAFVALGRIGRGRSAKGRGLAIAALVLNVVWIAAIVLAIVLSGPDPNADRYSGAKKPIAKVIDDFEDAAGDNDGDRLCSLMTEDLQQRVAAGSHKGTCAAEMGADDGVQAHLTAESITLVTPNGASAVVREDGKDLHFTFVKVGDTWKIAEIAEQ